MCVGYRDKHSVRLMSLLYTVQRILDVFSGDFTRFLVESD